MTAHWEQTLDGSQAFVYNKLQCASKREMLQVLEALNGTRARLNHEPSVTYVKNHKSSKCSTS
ncbi:hypothetical protein KSZ_70810 [Dictyobacter formicarum]|uniref:Uncharacterized protein n=1 Tax=Dictyobacter formicarum TaxID=2778368 RepID=A0ABQ3VT01_9CHLR|nr:hypothetical protein KSZ_70810 [Dictyobacter formicarum]